MKKLMIAAAVVCVALASQAASVVWSSVGKFTDSTGAVPANATAYSTALNGGSIVLVQLSALTGGGYDWAKATVLAGQTAPTFKTSPSSKKGLLSATFSFAYDETEGASNILGDGDILGVMFKDSSGKLSQLVYASDMKTTVDDVLVISGLDDITNGGDRWSGNLNYASAGNFTAVPEPTSGLLMLLGVAGLALRRRRA